MTALRLSASLAALAILAACGGGGESGAGAQPAPQATQAQECGVSTSSGDPIGLAKSLIESMTSDTAEPCSVADITLPASDTDDPQPI